MQYVISRHAKLRMQAYPKLPTLEEDPMYIYYNQLLKTGLDPNTGQKATQIQIVLAHIMKGWLVVQPFARAGALAYSANGYNQARNISFGKKTKTTPEPVKPDPVDGGSSKFKGVANPVPVLGRGNTGRIQPNNLNEQFAMHQVMSNPLEGAEELTRIKMADSRWPSSQGWVKMRNVVSLSNGDKIDIHYVYNKITGQFDDFKFKDN